MARACRRCGEEWTDKRSPGFREECGKCGQPLHCCANCRFYDDNAREWCREPSARNEKPRDREAGNTCEYFLFGDTADRSQQTDRERRAKEGLAALFGKPPPPATGDDKPEWMRPG